MVLKFRLCNIVGSSRYPVDIQANGIASLHNRVSFSVIISTRARRVDGRRRLRQ